MPLGQTKRYPHVAVGACGNAIDTYLKKAMQSECKVFRAVLFFSPDKEEIALRDADIEAVQYGVFVLLHTGRTEKFSCGSMEYFHKHSFCSDELIYVILDKKVRFIGIGHAGIKRHEENESLTESVKKEMVMLRKIW